MDGLLGDDLRNIADLGLHRFRLFAHGDRFRDPGQCQAYLHHGHAPHIKLHAVACLGGHAGRGSADVIASWRQHGEDELALGIALRFRAEASCRIQDGDLCAGDAGAADIFDHALQRGGPVLRDCTMRKSQAQQKKQSGAEAEEASGEVQRGDSPIGRRSHSDTTYNGVAIRQSVMGTSRKASTKMGMDCTFVLGREIFNRYARDVEALRQSKLLLKILDPRYRTSVMLFQNN